MERERTQQVAAGFNEVADEYDHPALRGFRLSADRLVEVAKLSPGQRILDVGTGTGNAALAAARAVGPEGRVTGVELAENMRAKASEKIAAAGLRNVEVQAGDATRLSFPDGSFDAVICASAIYTPPPVVEQIKAEYLAVMASTATDQGIWIDWQAIFCLGRKPPESNA